MYRYIVSDCDSCQQTFCSIIGYIFFKNEVVISHFLKQQPTIMCLFTKTEYTILYQTTKKVVWLCLLELELEGETFPITLKTDNKGSIVLIYNLEFHVWTKHINIKTHYIWEVVAQTDIKLEWV